MAMAMAVAVPMAIQIRRRQGSKFDNLPEMSPSTELLFDYFIWEL